MHLLTFQIHINDLIEAYTNKKDTDDFYLCHFIQYQYLPRRSIFHRIFLFAFPPSHQFTKIIADEFDCKQQVTINSMLYNHPDFNDISAYHSQYKYRLQLLHRMRELKPNLVFNMKY
jgi:hypothetical protein